MDLISESFFSNLTEKAKEWGDYFIVFSKEWGGYFIAFLGLVLVIIGIVQIVKAIVKAVAYHDRYQVNWQVILGMIGMMLVGGFLLVSSMRSILYFANVGVHYGCPNSKRINKLNLKRRKMKG